MHVHGCNFFVWMILAYMSVTKLFSSSTRSLRDKKRGLKSSGGAAMAQTMSILLRNWRGTVFEFVLLPLAVLAENIHIKVNVG